MDKVDIQRKISDGPMEREFKTEVRTTAKEREGGRGIMLSHRQVNPGWSMLPTSQDGIGAIWP